jgi:hypothetical protein
VSRPSSLLKYLPVSSTITINSKKGRNQRNFPDFIFVQQIPLAIKAAISK